MLVWESFQFEVCFTYIIPISGSMRYLVTILTVFVVFSCSTLEEDPEIILPSVNLLQECQDLGEGWSLPKNQVVGGGVGKDGIPAIENPKFMAVSDVSNLLDKEIVIGVSVNGEFKAYPHRILEKHEVVNDFVGEDYYSLTFCPLTGTSITWQRLDDNTFGVSGLLHNSNLITYDRKTDSNWSQIYSRGVNGENICVTLDYYPTIEMSWAAWRDLFPDSEVLTSETGFSRNYTQPPGSFSQPEDVIPLFPIHNIDNRLPNYERVLLVVIDGFAKAYQLSVFEGGTRMAVDLLAGKQVTLIGNQDLNFIVPYLNGLGLKYFSLDNGNLADTDGNVYNLFGEITEGPEIGESLDVPYSMMGYWFAVSAFYPEVEIYKTGEL